jgi:hypothetical protein
LFYNQIPHLHIFYSIFQAEHGKDYVPKAKQFYKDILARIQIDKQTLTDAPTGGLFL